MKAIQEMDKLKQEIDKLTEKLQQYNLELKIALDGIAVKENKEEEKVHTYVHTYRYVQMNRMTSL